MVKLDRRRRRKVYHLYPGRRYAVGDLIRRGYKLDGLVYKLALSGLTLVAEIAEDRGGVVVYYSGE